MRHFTSVHILANYCPIFKIHHKHILQTICNDVVIIYLTTL